jgi:hypothetical protein
MRLDDDGTAVTSAVSNGVHNGKPQVAAAGPLRALQMQMEREGLLQQQQDEAGSSSSSNIEVAGSSSSSTALAAKRGKKKKRKKEAGAAAATAAEFAVEDHKEQGRLWSRVAVGLCCINLGLLLLLQVIWALCCSNLLLLLQTLRTVGVELLPNGPPGQQS